MNIADTSNYTIRVSNDIYYIKNKTVNTLVYSLYKKNNVSVLVNTVNLISLQESPITFDGDGTYEVKIATVVAATIRYYLQLQSSLIISIADFLCNCFSTPISNTCNCLPNKTIKSIEYSSITLMLLSFQHLVNYPLNSYKATIYLFNAINLYEYKIRKSYLGHIQEECIKGKSLYGTEGLKYITAIYYILFLEMELQDRDIIDADYIYTKFDYVNIKSCIDDLGIDYQELKDILDAINISDLNITSDTEDGLEAITVDFEDV